MSEEAKEAGREEGEKRESLCSEDVERRLTEVGIQKTSGNIGEPEYPSDGRPLTLIGGTFEIEERIEEGPSLKEEPSLREERMENAEFLIETYLEADDEDLMDGGKIIKYMLKHLLDGSRSEHIHHNKGTKEDEHAEEKEEPVVYTKFESRYLYKALLIYILELARDEGRVKNSKGGELRAKTKLLRPNLEPATIVTTHLNFLTDGDYLKKVGRTAAIQYIPKNVAEGLHEIAPEEYPPPEEVPEEKTHDEVRDKDLTEFTKDHDIIYNELLTYILEKARERGVIRNTDDSILKKKLQEWKSYYSDPTYSTVINAHLRLLVERDFLEEEGRGQGGYIRYIPKNVAEGLHEIAPEEYPPPEEEQGEPGEDNRDTMDMMDKELLRLILGRLREKGEVGLKEVIQISKDKTHYTPLSESTLRSYISTHLDYVTERSWANRGEKEEYSRGKHLYSGLKKLGILPSVDGDHEEPEGNSDEGGDEDHASFDLIKRGVEGALNDHPSDKFTRKDFVEVVRGVHGSDLNLKDASILQYISQVTSDLIDEGVVEVVGFTNGARMISKVEEE